MASDKKTLIAEANANASAKRNLMSVGGCGDTPVHWSTDEVGMVIDDEGRHPNSP
jgi:hypothetical protein